MQRRLKKEKKERVTIRLEPSLVFQLKRIADREGKEYQAMIREWLWENTKKRVNAPE